VELIFDHVSLCNNMERLIQQQQNGISGLLIYSGSKLMTYSYKAFHA